MTARAHKLYVQQFVNLQVLLLLLMFISVPWMLLPKPLILKKRYELSKSRVSSLTSLMSDTIAHLQHPWQSSAAVDRVLQFACELCHYHNI